MNGPPPQTTFTAQSGKSTFISNPRQKVAYTANRETDCRTALCRGLADYLEQLSFSAPDGNVLTFEKVFATWASPEEDAAYDSACVHTNEPGIYEDGAGFTPNISPDHRVADPADGRYVITPNGFQIDMEIEVRATTAEARKWLVAMLEDALDPVDWGSGLRLALPHYYGQHATYKKLTMEYLDDSENVEQGLRMARVRVRGNVPETRLQFTPQMIIRTSVEASTDPLDPGPNVRTASGT